MRLKKIIAGVLAAMMCLSPISAIAADPTSAGATDVPTQFHYEQLDDTAKQVYAGIYAMYENGLLKTGTQDYDLAANGHFSKEQIAEYAKNSSKLTSAMTAARYAFYADYPDVFYVNFPKLTLRTTKGSDGTIHIYLGSGRYENYYIDGFSSESDVDLAIQAFDQRVDEIVAGARELESDGEKNLQKKQIQYVHNEIIRHTSYRLEDACFDGDDENPSNGIPHKYGIIYIYGECGAMIRLSESVYSDIPNRKG